MHHGLLTTLKRLKGACDQVLACLHEHLHSDVVRDQVFIDQAAHEVELNLRGGRKTHLDLFKAALQKRVKKGEFLLDGHRIDQRLVTVAQIDARPDRGAGDLTIGPSARKTWVKFLRRKGKGLILSVVV